MFFLQHCYALAFILLLGTAQASSPCARILRAARHFTKTNEKLCQSRLEHKDIEDKIKATCLPSSTDKLARRKWTDFKTEFSKSYKSKLDEILHCISFEDSLREIELHNIRYNAGLSNYFLKVTSFADLSNKEFKTFHVGDGSPAGTKPTDPKDYPKFLKKTPESLDYRKLGYVTPVGNQKLCAACWAFAAVAAVEGQYFKKTGQLKKFSEQQIVDCAYRFNKSSHNGCKAGDQKLAFDYIRQKGIALAEDYPFHAKSGRCKESSVTPVTKIKRQHMLTLDDEVLMQRALATTGPLAIAFLWLPQTKLYGGGVFDFKRDCIRKPDWVNHVVLAVGYGTTDKGQDYWILKNSVGPRWGEDGFLRVPRGSNYCAVGHEVSVIEM